MIVIHLEAALAKKKMTLSQLADEVGITIANMSLLKTSKVKGIRFETLSKICDILEVQPGDIIEYVKD